MAGKKHDLWFTWYFCV